MTLSELYAALHPQPVKHFFTIEATWLSSSPTARIYQSGKNLHVAYIRFIDHDAIDYIQLNKSAPYDIIRHVLDTLTAANIDVR